MIVNQIGTSGSSSDNAEIGDIKITTSIDLGDNWLLCNGESISKEDYPNLANLIKGYEIVSPGDKSVSLSCVFCYNGTWVAGGYDPGGPSAYIFTTTDPKGSWSGKALGQSGYISGIHCYNGRWVAVGYTPYGHPVVSTTTNPTGSWNSRNLNGSAYHLSDVFCYNGRWVATGYENGNRYPYVYTTTDPTGSWTENKISDRTNVYNSKIFCYRGTWVTVGYIYNSNPIIFTTTNPAGTWTENIISDKLVELTNVNCDNGTWTAIGQMSGYPVVFKTSKPTGKWNMSQLSTVAIPIRGIYSYDGIQVLVGNTASGSYPKIMYDQKYSLPSISIDGAYAYIKAKN